MDIQSLIESLPIGQKVSPLMLFGLLLFAGAVGGQLAKLVRLPTITGNIFGGVIIGPYCLKLVEGEETIRSLAPLTSFAMSLIAVYIGGHLSWRRIHNAIKRIAFIGVGEGLGAAALVFIFVWLLTRDAVLALLLSAFAVDSAPATILHIVSESKAKGTFVKTLLSAVGVDNILAVIYFAIVTAIAADIVMHDRGGLEKGYIVTHLVWGLAGSVALGVAMGRTAAWLIRRPGGHHFTIVFLTVLFSEGVASYLGVSTLMTGLVLGIYLGNAGRDVETQLRALEPIELIIFVAFFTLAGVNLHISELPHIGWVGVAFVVGRFAGLTLGGMLGGVASGSSRRIWSNISLGLMPQAGLAIALLVTFQAMDVFDAELRHQISTMVLAAVVVNEIFGPLFTRMALKRARETNKDRPRLMEFLQEEFIMTGLEAGDRFEAIRKLTDFLVLTHQVEHMDAEELYRSILKREKSEPTAIGNGAAIPHGMLEKGPAIQGVLGICREGIEWDSPDGRPVRLIMLIITPQDHSEAHLKVLASLAAMVRDEVICSRLISARNANEAWEIIEGEETPNYNYFLED